MTDMALNTQSEQDKMKESYPIDDRSKYKVVRPETGMASVVRKKKLAKMGKVKLGTEKPFNEEMRVPYKEPYKIDGGGGR